MFSTDNIMFETDGYKPTHWMMYPPGMTRNYGYLESRGGPYARSMFFGLQAILLQSFVGTVVTRAQVLDAANTYRPYYGADYFNKKGWMHISEDHAGKLPLRICAVPEGSLHATHSVLATMENTCPQCAWLPGYLESRLLQVWYPTTVGTNSYDTFNKMLPYYERTGTPESMKWRLHDFGYRGSTSNESAAIGGGAHLVSWRGSDTIMALPFLKHYYDGENVADSIAAGEHSTIMAWGRDGEVEAYRNMIRSFPGRTIAAPVDTYDTHNALKNIWGSTLAREILDREGTFVARPDSGPVIPTLITSLSAISSYLGYETNDKGFWVMTPKARLLEGDGVNSHDVDEILGVITKKKWSADNLFFGMGGALLQNFTRDTMQFAYKSSWVEVDGEGRNIYKDPIDAPGKRSKAGRFDNLNLPVVFENGWLLRRWTLSEIQARAEAAR